MAKAVVLPGQTTMRSLKVEVKREFVSQKAEPACKQQDCENC